MTKLKDLPKYEHLVEPSNITAYMFPRDLETIKVLDRPHNVVMVLDSSLDHVMERFNVIHNIISDISTFDIGWVQDPINLNVYMYLQSDIEVFDEDLNLLSDPKDMYPQLPELWDLLIRSLNWYLYSSCPKSPLTR